MAMRIRPALFPALQLLANFGIIISNPALGSHVIIDADFEMRPKCIDKRANRITFVRWIGNEHSLALFASSSHQRSRIVQWQRNVDTRNNANVQNSRLLNSKVN